MLEKQIPVDTVKIEETVHAFSWEPVGTKFAIGGWQLCLLLLVLLILPSSRRQPEQLCQLLQGPEGTSAGPASLLFCS